MKNYCLILLFSFAAVFGAAQKEELPIEVKVALDSHVGELLNLLKEWNARSHARKGFNTSCPEWLSGHLIKYGIERIANAERIRTVAREHGLNVSVSKKYPYHVPGMPDVMSSENYLVIVEEVFGKTGKGQCLNLKQAQDLCKVALLAEHYDLHPGNYFSKPNGELIIIDTDADAMPSQEKIEELKADWLLHGTRVYGCGICMDPKIINDPLVKIDLPRFSRYSNYDDQAAAHIREQVALREQQRIELLKLTHE